MARLVVVVAFGLVPVHVLPAAATPRAGTAASARLPPVGRNGAGPRNLAFPPAASLSKLAAGMTQLLRNIVYGVSKNQRSLSKKSECNRNRVSRGRRPRFC